jgi:hypothetical protein
VLGAAHVAAEAHGGAQIARLAAGMWERDYAYLADPRRIVQARDTALVVGGFGINVVHRRRDGSWRYAISLLEIDSKGEHQ